MNTHIEKAIKIVGDQSTLADAADVSQTAIWKLLHGKTKRISGEIAVAIHKATNGEVSKYEMRPDLFSRNESE